MLSSAFKTTEYKKKTGKFSSKCIVHIQHYMLRIKCFIMLRNLTQNIMYWGRKTALQNNHFKHKVDDSQPTSTYIYIYLLKIKHRICAIQNNTPVCLRCFRYFDSMLLTKNVMAFLLECWTERPSASCLKRWHRYVNCLVLWHIIQWGHSFLTTNTNSCESKR